MLVIKWTNLNPFTLLVGMQNGANILKNTVEIPQKIVKYYPVTSKYIFKRNEIKYSGYTYILIFIAALFTIITIEEQHKCLLR